MTIKQLIEKYQSDRNYYLTNKYNETLLRSDFLDPFFELLGWDIKNNAGKPTNEREVILEEALKANASENSKKPDYTFRLYSERKFFLEAKKPFVKIEADNETAKQVRRYGFTAKLKISVLSNFEYLIIYDTSVKVEKEDTFQKALVKKYHYTEYESKFDEIKRLLGKEEVYSGTFDNEWKAIENKLNQYSIDNLFLKQINEWRKALGTEIHKYEPKIDEQQLNDIVQSYLNRVLFLRVCEDRNLEDYQTLLKFANTNDFNALIKKFEQADKRYNSGLFDQLLKDKIIENISSVFWTIIQHLYYPESPYSFSVFSSDVLGSIYEIFLSEKLVIQNGAVELVKKPENIDRDIVTTPTFIINDILRNTVLSKCNDKNDKEILQLKFADIACGSGAFLLELFQLLNDILIDYYLKNDKSKLIQTNINTYKLPFEIKRKVLLNCVYGIDKDYNAVEATKFGLLLKLLENEDVNSTNKTKPVLPDLSENIFFGNSLLNPSQVEKKNQNEINPFDFSKLRFDVIVGNPPYMKSEDMKNITPLELPLYKTNYTSAYKQFDKYFLFLEQGLDLLTDDGILGYIVPSKFTKVGAGKKLRELLSEKEYLHSIVSFGANQVFADKTTYTCLLILNKKPQNTFQYAEVKSLNSWKVREPEAVKYASKNTEELDSEVWILVPPELTSAYNKIVIQSEKLVDLIGDENIFNGIQTSANDVYIFTPEKEDKKYYFFSKKGIEYKIEKEITKPYFKTSSGEDNLYTYRTFKPNARVIYPYTPTKTGVDIIPLTTIQKKFPLAYEYLQANKAVLNNPKRGIKPIPQTQNEWHRYGRHQSLDSCGLPQKIIVGVLSVGDKYAIDIHGTLISSGGTAGYCVVAIPENSEYSIYYIQAILNSKYLEWFSALYGEVFRGGYIARGTKVLKNLPIRKIDFSKSKEKALHDKIVSAQKELIGIYDQIDANAGNKRTLTPLQAQFAREKANLDKLLAKLYDLGDDDLLIPLIKELYEAN
ncbi:Type IIS restriction enzyme Eco57I [Candidatus Ornithobacterium hominis]|uniref:site-specific DNA-methyltransferase (adenine-specific) n=1 Tax=Candidatus Ornithobacterium hominis TaxID=2497989 RepID=A0A383U416_9FLAO|nr:Eco57I restriction-modification methylase domain-containing protein [Candidatus Ornithobacterium hominis]MCT7905190.1 Eco57I restriction-modification methylase domain-containing protein [Candidatus Ornithobacterium hominis]SZD74307.1 Type IIS restriction enzyme Eco57I [Candidatus Ornithobacterium hominis]